MILRLLCYTPLPWPLPSCCPLMLTTKLSLPEVEARTPTPASAVAPGHFMKAAPSKTHGRPLILWKEACRDQQKYKFLACSLHFPSKVIMGISSWMGSLLHCIYVCIVLYTYAYMNICKRERPLLQGLIGGLESLTRGKEWGLYPHFYNKNICHSQHWNARNTGLKT